MNIKSKQPETFKESKTDVVLDALTGYPPEDRDKYVDIKGWRLRAPWRCMCCGKMISLRQFCFGRCCAPCDTGNCVGHRKIWDYAYSGPREIIDEKAEYFIKPDKWLNPPEGLSSHPDDKTFPELEEYTNRMVAKWEKAREQHKAYGGK